MPTPEIHSDIEELQELLKEIRREKDLTQTEIAAVLEQSQSFVSKYESGERILDILEVRFICNRLGLPLAEFCARLETKISLKKDRDSETQ
jgi:transcriptional regulator with XRE-family HTH domain